jgi:hypothetical protein
MRFAALGVALDRGAAVNRRAFLAGLGAVAIVPPLRAYSFLWAPPIDLRIPDLRALLAQDRLIWDLALAAAEGRAGVEDVQLALDGYQYRLGRYGSIYAPLGGT